MAQNLEQRLTNTQQAPAQQRKQPATLADQIKQMESQFAMAMPRGAEASQLVRDALTTLRQTPKLGDCDPASVLGGLMSLAQLGLRPGVLGHAWLLPFYDKNSRGFKAQVVIGYQGLVELAHRSGQIKSLIARTVYEHDTFEVDYGLEDNLVHKPAMRGPKGEPIAYYAVAKFTTGGHAFIVMNHDEMIEYRDKHATAKTREGKVVGPWRDNFDGMARKTVVRQLSKWMPKSTDMARAIESDESVRVDLTPAAIDYPQHIDGEVLDDHPTGQPVEPTAEGAPTE